MEDFEMLGKGFYNNKNGGAYRVLHVGGLNMTNKDENEEMVTYISFTHSPGVVFHREINEFKEKFTYDEEITDSINLIIKEVREGCKLSAVKELKYFAGLFLKEAKEIIDELRVNTL